jgi:putative membrane protein
MDYMFKAGFLGTRAPFFMDIVTLIVAILPLLVFGAILFARKKQYKLHMISQNIIFLVSLVVIVYFELGVRIGGGFDAFISESEISPTYALLVLIFHIMIAVGTLYYWSITIFNANYSYIKNDLPGKGGASHKKVAVKAMLGIILTSFTGIWVYLLLFVF